MMVDRATLASILTQAHRDAGLQIVEDNGIYKLKDGEKTVIMFLDLASLRGTVRDLADIYLRDTMGSTKPQPNYRLPALRGNRPS